MRYRSAVPSVRSTSCQVSTNASATATKVVSELRNGAEHALEGVLRPDDGERSEREEQVDRGGEPEPPEALWPEAEEHHCADHGERDGCDDESGPVDEVSDAVAAECEDKNDDCVRAHPESRLAIGHTRYGRACQYRREHCADLHREHSARICVGIHGCAPRHARSRADGGAAGGALAGGSPGESRECREGDSGATHAH